MKSYKDLPEDIILNAPEGAMWVAYAKDQDNSNMYYKVKDGELLVHYGHWTESVNNNIKVAIFNEPWHDFIPLPNVEIPWEATEDSKCPVPVGIYGQARYADDFGENYYNPIMELVDFLSEEWKGTGKATIVSYKIIDEDYLPTKQEEDIVSYKLPLYTSDFKIEEKASLEDKLTKRLEFLQNLANKFPEIKDEAIKFMECELDGYMNTLW